MGHSEQEAVPTENRFVRYLGFLRRKATHSLTDLFEDPTSRRDALNEATGVAIGILAAKGGQRLKRFTDEKIAELDVHMKTYREKVFQAIEEGGANNLQLVINTGSSLMDIAVATRLRTNSITDRLDLTLPLAAYEVASASARPMNGFEHEGIHIRRITAGSWKFRDDERLLYFDIVGRNQLFFGPLPYLYPTNPHDKS